MNLEDFAKRIAVYQKYVDDCDASGLSITEFAKQQGCKREHYYHCQKAIRSFEAKKAEAQKAAPAKPDSRLPILSLSGKNFHLEAYPGFDQTMALTMLAFAMQHEEEAYNSASECESITTAAES